MRSDQIQTATRAPDPVSRGMPQETAPMTIVEPFVSADEAASFLAVKRRYLLALARKGIAGAYGLSTGMRRKTWVFRLSELASSVAGKK